MYWQLYLVWLGILSVITCILYGIDKLQAKSGGRRIPEAALHIISLAGGFAGGWAGRVVFRHKTQKGFFTFILILSTVLHLCLGYWWFLR
jgi:uncharacterized membrane protein YsdA (DUF1294 family)